MSRSQLLGALHIRPTSVCTQTGVRAVSGILIALVLLCAGTAQGQTAHFAGVSVGSGLSNPVGVAVDASGNVYITDYANNRLLKETYSGGAYTQTVIASGLDGPEGVSLDSSGNIYFVDTNQRTVVKETLSGGTYTPSTIFTQGANGIINPNDLAVDASGNIYIADTTNERILLETLSGGSYTQTALFSTNGLIDPGGVAVDAAGDVYIADTNNSRVLKETLSSGSYTQTVVAHTGLNHPLGVLVDGSGNVYISDKGNNRVLLETLSGGTYTQSVFASNLSTPGHLAMDSSGDIYIADGGNNRVLLVPPGAVSFGTVNVGTTSSAISLSFTFDTAGTLTSKAALTLGSAGLDFADAGTGTCTAGTAYAIAAVCTVNVTLKPKASGFRMGAVTLNNSAGAAIAMAYLSGTGSGPQAVIYPGTQSTVGSGLSQPFGAAVDGSGNVYISDTLNSRLLKETLSGGSYTQSVVDSSLNHPYGLAVDGAGNIYVADTANNRVVVETPAGGSYTQGIVVSSGLNGPTGIAVDASGSVYFTDNGNSRVLKETPSGSSYTQSVIATSGLYSPIGIAVDGSDNLYIVDDGNARIVKETLSGGSYTQSVLVSSGLNGPYGIGVDGGGNLYIADTFNNRILLETLSGGSYTQSVLLGTGLGQPFGVEADGNGNVYIADTANSRILKLDVVDTQTLTFNSTAYGATSSDSPQTLTLWNLGNAALKFAVPGSGNNPIISTSFSLDSSSSGTCPLTVHGASSPGTLAADTSCTLPISFIPAAIGSITGALVFTDNNLNGTNVTQTTDLNGTATQAAQAINFTAPTSPVNYGVAPVTLVATGGASGNPVTFSIISGSGFGTLSGTNNNTLTITGPGTIVIAANQAGNTDYSAAPQVTRSIVVNQLSPTITFSVPNHVFGDAPFTVAASSNSTGAITYSVASGGATVSGSTVTLTGAGPVTLQASQAAGGFYAAGTQSATFTVSTFSEPVHSTSSAQTATISITSSFTLGSISVVTQGATGLDFNVASGGTCTVGTVYTSGQSCTVKYTFTPQYPGVRSGAVLLYNNNATPVLEATTYLSGIGTGPQPVFIPGIVSTIAGNGIATYVPSQDGGLATSAAVNQPATVTVDSSGNIYIADTSNNRIRKIAVGTGIITTIAGTGTAGYVASQDGGLAVNAELDNPGEIAIDGAGNLYFGDEYNNRVRKIAANTGIITTVAGDGTFGVGFAGVASGGYNGDGIAATSAYLNFPSGVALDAGGDIYIADQTNNRIRKVAAGTGIITTVAGTGIAGYNGDSIAATSAALNSPVRVSVDPTGNLYISDSANNRVRKVAADTGIITTVLGTDSPRAVAIDAAGDLYVAESLGNRILLVTPAGSTTVLAGTGATCNNPKLKPACGDTGAATSAQFRQPEFVTIDGAGNLYIADQLDDLIRKVTVSTTPTLTFGSTAVAYTSSAQTVSLFNTGNTALNFNIPGSGNNPAISTNFSLNSSFPGTCPLTASGASTPGTLASGTACTLPISFAPITSGTIVGSLVATDNSLNATSATQTVVLNGTATLVAGSASRLVFVTAPASSLSTGDNAGTVTVDIQDTGADVITTASASVKLTVTGPNSYSKTYGPTSTTSGVVSFNTSANALTTPGTYTYTATATSLTSAVATETVVANVTTTTLAITSGATPVTTVATGTAVTLTASVETGSTPITTGQVEFCNAASVTCTDINLLGTAQITSADTATLTFIPGIGSHSYYAIFAGTTLNGTSTSGNATLTVTGTYPTVTTIGQSGSAGNYTLTATVTGTGSESIAPTGTVSFLDTNNSNYALGTAALGAGTAGLIFTNPNTINPATGTKPFSIAAGDFNGDGVADLAVANQNSNTLSILLGNGDGTFTLKSSPATGNMPQSVAVGDFNGDGKEDLAVANFFGSTVTILLGNGDGTFTAAAVSPATGDSPSSVAVGDFNGDGNADLAVANYNDNSVTILLGKGDGTFTAAAASPTVGTQPYSIAVGDLNGDGNTDLAVANLTGDTVSILLGNGDGTFTLKSSPAVNVPYSVSVGDFNGDGNADLAVATLGGVSVLLGNGDGTFGAAASLTTVTNAYSSVAVGDFNGDGKDDLAAANSTGTAVAVFLGNGDGTFTAWATPATGSYPSAVAVSDFNGDGNADLAVANQTSNSVTVLLTHQTETATASVSSISPVGTGTHNVEASYPGDTNYSASVSSTTGLTAQKVTTALTLGANPASPITYGQTVTLTGTLSPYTAQNQTTDTEAVTFSNGATTLGSGALASGVASSTLSLPVGVYSLKAAYTADTNFAGVTSTSSSFTVSKQTPTFGTMSFTPASPETYGTSQAITISDTLAYTGSGSAPGGAVKYVLNGVSYTASCTGTSSPLTCTATVPAATIAVLSAAAYTVTAGYTTDTNYAAATGTSGTFTITQQASPTFGSMGFTPASTEPYSTSQAITISDTLNYSGSGAAPSGAVTFVLNGVSYTAGCTGSSGVRSCSATVPAGTIALLPAAAYTVTASYTADTNYPAATGTSGSFTISKASQTISFTAPPTPVTYGVSASTLSATGGASGNVVTFTTTGPCTIVSSTTLLITGAGSCVVTANQLGNTNYAAATAVQQTITVNKATLTVAAASPTITYGTAVPAYTATISGYVNGDTSAVVSGAASLTTSPATPSTVGTYPITAAIGTLSATNYTFSFTNGTLTITQASQAISFTAPATPVIYGVAPVTLVATGGGSSNAVTFGVSGPCSVVSTTLTITGVGSCIITANQAGNTNYAAATAVQQTIVVNPATLSVVAASPTITYGTAVPAYTAVISGYVNGDTSAVVSGSPSLTTSPATPSAAGTYPITAAIGTLAASNYTFSFTNGTLTITQASQTINFTAPATPVTYGVAPVTLVATGGGSSNAVTFGVSGPCSVVSTTLTITGAGSCVITANQAGNANYSAATAVQKTIVVNKATLNVAATSPTIAYGSAVPAYAATITGYVNGDTIAVVSGSPSLTTSPATPSAVGTYTITAGTGSLAAANYTFSFTNGTLTITQGSQTISFGALADKLATDPPFLVSATASSSLPVSFSVYAATAYGWANGTVLPAALNTAVAGAPGDGMIYVAGGNSGAGGIATLQQYNPITKVWTAKTSKPTPVYQAAAASIGGLLYVAGGWNYPITSLPTNVLEVYNPATNTWASEAPMLRLSACGVAGAINGKLYVMTACNGNTGYYGILDVYDPGANSWSNLTSAPVAHGSGAGGVINGKLYVAGGVNSAGTATAELDAYDPTLNSWTTLTAMPAALSGMAGDVIDGKLYVVGGNAGSAYSSTVYVYDPVANAWSTYTAITTALSNSAVVATGGTLFVSGGNNGGGSSNALQILNTNNCTLSGSTVTIDGPGICTVTASQAGNSSYTAATPVAQSFSITSATQAISFTAPITPVTYGVTPISLAATGGGSGNAVVFSVVSGPATVSGSTLTITGAGTVTVAANQAGNASYTAAPQVTQTIVVNKALLNVTAASPTILYGASVPAYTATITGYVNGDASTVVSGAPSLTTSPATPSAVGTYTITAALGTLSAVNYTFTFTNGTLTISAASPVITFAVPNHTFGDAPFTVAAASNSTGAFTYSVVSGPATISGGNTVTLTGAGSITLKATEAADANYTAGSQTATFTASAAAPTITFVVPNHIFGDAAFTVAATSNSTGVFTYSVVSGPATISGGNTVTLTGAGSVTLMAAEAADANYTAGSQIAIFTVAAAAPTITFSVPNHTYGDAPFTVAAASNSTGAFSYAVLSGPASVTGNSVTLTGSGTVTLQASEVAAGNYSAGSQNATFTVATAVPTITFTVPNHTYGDAAFAVTATSNSAGAITYSVVSGPATISGNTVTLTGSGTVVLQAAQVAAGSYASGTQNATFTVATAVPAITFTVPNHTYGDAAFTVTATSNSSGAITYSVVSGPATLSGNTVTLTGSGTVVLQAAQVAAGSYSAGTQNATFTVAAASPVIAFTVPNHTFGDAPFTVTATSNSPGAITYSVFSGPASISGGNTVTLTGAGTVVLQATQAAATGYSAGTQNATFTVATAAPTITFAVPGHNSTDAPFTVTATSNSAGAISYSVVSGPATISGGNTVTLTGSGTVVLQASQVAAGNYSAGTQNATFSVAAPGSPTITFAVPNHTYGDAPFTVTATSNSTGTITYSVLSGPATIASNTVTLTGSGTVVLQASQVAAGVYSAGTQTASFTVAAAAPAISFAVPNHTYGDAAFAVTATSNSAGAITYSVLSGPVTISGSTVTLTGSGAVVLQASQAAAGSYLAGTQTASFTVAVASPVITFTVPNHVFGDAPFTVNATSNSTGAITYSVVSGPATISGGNTVTLTGSGPVVLQATQAAAGSYTSGTQTASFSVSPAVTAITFTVPNHTYGDAPFPVSATSNSAGAITYSVVSGPASISGNTVTLTGSGTVVLNAAQVAAGSYSAGTQNATFTVAAAVPVINFTVPNHTYGDAAFAIAATSNSTGAITYSVVSGPASIAGNTVTLTGAGNVTLKATEVADANYTAGSQTATFTVAVAAPTITFTVPNHTYGDAPFAVTATSNSAGAFTYTVLSGPANITGSTVTLTGPGTVVLQANQAAAGNYAAGSQNATFIVAAAGAPAIVFTVPNHTYGDAPFAVTATSNSSGAFSYSILSGPATIAGNVVTLTGSGIVVLEASEAAAGVYSVGTQTASFNVSAIAPAITFSVPNHTYGDAPFTVAATSNSAGAFTYTVLSGPASIAGSAVTLTGSGTVVLQASEAAAGGYTAGAQTASFSVASGAPTISFSVANHVYGDAPFTVSATSNSAGAFTYSVLSGPASIAGSTVTITGSGTVVLQASEAAAGGYSAGTQTASFNVAVAAPAITFAVPNHIYGDAPFTVSATSNSTGAFTYSVVSGAATVSGSTVTLTGAGSVTLKASEAADANYSAGTQNATFSVATATPTISFTVANHIYGDAPFAVNATSNSGGAITYSVVSGAASITGNTVTLTGAGTVVLQASQAAAGNYAAATQNATFSVATVVPTIVFSVPNHTFGDAPFAVAATSNSSGAVTYSVVSGAATIAGNTVTLTGAGTVVLQASQAAAGNYAAGTQAATFTVSATTPTIAFSVPNHIYGDATFTVAATSNSAGVITYSVVSGPATVSGNAVTLTGAGSVTLAAAQAASAPYIAGSTQAVFSVAKATPAIAWATPTAISYGAVIGGTQLNAAATGVGGGALPGTYVYTPIAGTVPAPPSQTISLLFTPADSVDYTTATASVNLAVTQAVLTIAANSATRVYGTANPVFTGAITGQQNGDSFTESFSTPAVTLSPVASYPIIPSAAGAALANYTQSIQNGTLSITQADTTAALTVGTQNAIAGQNNTYTATIASTTTGTPTGTVQFFDNGVVFGSATLTAGQATLTSAALGAGSHTITIAYSGDTNFKPSTASSGSVVITVTLPDFSMALTGPSTVSMPFGSTASFAFHIAPLNGSYYQAVTFSYSGQLPLDAQAVFSPVTVAANAGPTDVTFTITTTRLAGNRKPAVLGGEALLCILLLPFALVRRLRQDGGRARRFAMLGCVVMLTMGAVLGVSGCGTGYAAETYPITITASSGSVVHTATVTVQIQQTPQ